MLLIASSINSNVDVQRENITIFDILALKPFIMLFLPQEGISLQGKESRLLLEANVRLEILRGNLNHGHDTEKEPCRSNVRKSSAGYDKSHAEQWLQELGFIMPPVAEAVLQPALVGASWCLQQEGACCRR